MNEQIFANLADKYPYLAAIITLILLLFRSKIVAILPKVVQDHFTDRAKLRADEQEHKQEAERAARELARMKELADLSSSSFVESQVTHMASEAQVQLNEANSFVRDIVSNKLDVINGLLIGLRENFGQLKETQAFILQELKRDDRHDGIIKELQAFVLQEIRENDRRRGGGGL